MCGDLPPLVYDGLLAAISAALLAVAILYTQYVRRSQSRDQRYRLLPPGYVLYSVLFVGAVGAATAALDAVLGAQICAFSFSDVVGSFTGVIVLGISAMVVDILVRCLRYFIHILRQRLTGRLPR